MKKLTLKKEVISSLSYRSMARILGGREDNNRPDPDASNRPSDASSAPCRCDSGETDGSQMACISNALAGCSTDCSRNSCHCGGGGGGGSDDQEHVTDHD